MKTVRQDNIKDKQGYFFSEMIKIKNVNLHLLDIDLVTLKRNDIAIYDIKKYLNCSNSLYLFFNNLEPYIEKNNGDKF